MKSNSSSNGGTSVRSIRAETAQFPPAKWLIQSEKTPPPAFFVPLDVSADQFVKITLNGAEGEKRVTELALRDFGSRFAGLLERFREERIVAADGRADCDRRIRSERAARDKLDKDIVCATTAIQFPSGARGVCVGLFGALFVSVILLEWFNTAGFAARSEMQSMLAALGYTFSVSLVPVALELACLDRSRSRRIVSSLLILVTGFFFLNLFSDAYVTANPNATSDEILAGQPTAAASAMRFWNDPLNPHWRLMWQMLLATAVGMALARFLASQISVIRVTASKPNPAYLNIDKRLPELLRERDEWGERLAEAEGNIREWQHSEKLHVAWRIWLFQREERRRQLLKQANDFVLNELNDASAPLLFASNHQNHNPK